MMRAATIVCVLAFSACVTTPGDHDDEAPAAIAQAAEQMCGWLIAKTPPPTREAMAELNWQQIMTREKVVIPESMQRFANGLPALAAYGREFGTTGKIMASYWEDYCIGSAWSDNSSAETVKTRAAQTAQRVDALEGWVIKVLPDAVPVALSFKPGEATDAGRTVAYIARANDHFLFRATINGRGAIEWRLGPSPSRVAPSEPAKLVDEVSGR